MYHDYIRFSLRHTLSEINVSNNAERTYIYRNELNRSDNTLHFTNSFIAFVKHEVI